MGRVRRRFGAGPGRIVLAALLLGTSVGSGVVAATSAMAQSTAPASFSVPAGDLGAALTAFGRQAGLQIRYTAQVAAGRTTSGVSGTMAPVAALSRLLAGTGLSYSFPDSDTVDIFVTGAEQVANDGSIVLEEVNVTGVAGSGAAADAPYETAGTSTYVSGEQLNRIPVTSAGDLFAGVPGVSAPANRASGTMDINIRGLQGNGRVATLVDGTSATTSAYKGYAGNQDRNTVDAALLSSVSVDKGPTTGPQGIGSIGGVVNMTTINVEDVLLPGHEFGVMLKTSVGTNSIAPILNGTSAYTGDASVDGADEIDFSNWNGSVAVATSTENFDFLLAYSAVNQGNYYAGSEGSTTNSDGDEMSPIGLGSEVYNTSRDTDTLLAKGTVRFDDGQSVKVTVQKYHGDLGETMNEALNYSGSYGFAEQQQNPLTERDVTSGKIEYRWEAPGNDLIDLHANVWTTYTEEYPYLISGLSTVQNDFETHSTGVELWNTSLLDTGLGGLELSYGGQYLAETASSSSTTNPNGERQLYAGFAQGKLGLTDWLDLQGGVRVEGYHGDADSSTAVEREYSRVNPNIGLTVTPIDGVQLFATYTEGWRPPSIREINGQSSLTAASDLEPEVSKNIEVGVNYLANDVFMDGDSVKLKLAYFDNTYDNYIVRYGSSSPYVWDNIDKAVFRGIELSGAYDMGRVFVEGSFNYYTDIEYCLPGYACGEGTNSDYGASQVPATYSGALTVGTRWLDDNALTLGASVKFFGEQYEISNLGGSYIASSIMAQWDPEQIYGLFATYKVNENVELNASIENLFDTYYLDAQATALVPAPGRTVKVGLTGKF